MPTSLPTQTPPLLLTKRLTSFLHANKTPQLPTLLVTSPTGKLLAHASPQPVSLLRTHATVAASLLSIHTSSSPALPSALPGSRTPPTREEQEDDSEDQDGGDSNGQRGRGQQHSEEDTLKPATITIQLTGGIVLIRRLKCGLLFVCVGPASTSSTSSPGAGGAPATASANNATNQSGETSQLDMADTLAPSSSQNPIVSTSPSEADSLVSLGTQTASGMDSQSASAAVAMRKHAAELARWLDDKLGTLAVPDDGVGVE